MECYYDYDSTASDDIGINDEEYPPWLHLYNWRFSGYKACFSPLILLLDLITAATILLLVAIGMEWRRRRGLRVWQFTLREIILVMFVLAGALAYWRTNHLRAEKEIAFAESEREDYSSRYHRDYQGPVFLEKLFGMKYLDDFFTVTHYSLEHKNNKSQKAYLPFSAELTNIEILICVNASHDDIEEIQKLRHLKVLALFDSTLSHQDYISLSRISSLKGLRLLGTKIAPNALLSLRSLPRLEWLILEDSDIGDESARALASLGNLTFLYLRKTHLSDASVSYLANLTRLKELHIQDCDITPHGCERLRILLPQCEMFYETANMPPFTFPIWERTSGMGMF